MGCCTPLGVTAGQLLEKVRDGANAGQPFQKIRISDDLAAEQEEILAAVTGPEPATISGLRRPFPDRPTLMAIIAVDEAISAAGLDTRAGDGTLRGLVMNTCFGPNKTVERFLRSLLQEGPTQVSAIAFSRAVFNATAGEISRRHNLRGPGTNLLGSSSLIYGIDLLADESVEAIVCAGVDEVRDLALWAYRHAGMLEAGLRLGEGAAALVVERPAAATARGARIIARVVGHSMSFCADSVHRITDVTEESLACSMEEALRRSGRAAAHVAWVVGADNGHEALREAERSAVRRVIGRDVQWLRPKCVLGESFGASEGLGVIVGASALQVTETRPGAVPLCLVNACQVGGSVSSLVLEKTL